MSPPSPDRPPAPGDGPPRLPRRAFLAGAGAAALAGAGAVVAGCGGAGRASAGRPRPSVAPPRAVRPAAAGAEPTDPAAWAALAASLSGRLVRPGDLGYRLDRQLYDFRFDGVRPAGIAYCATEDDVARCLAFARRHDLTPRPRAGGHSYAGYSTGDGLVVDVTTLHEVAITTHAGVSAATIGAGARLIDVYSALGAAGVSVPAGSCPTVGLAGLALGGGIGVMVRSEGLTSDRVLSLRMVTTDSRIVTASAEQNPDLFWACRGGGGGNFGVVTSLRLSTFPTEAVTVFGVAWPWAAADQVVPAWMTWVARAPETLWANCLLLAAPGSAEPNLEVTGVHRGSPTDAAALLGRLISEVGTPASLYRETVPFTHAMYVEAGCAGLERAECRLPSQGPRGRLTRQPSVAKSDLLTEPLPARAVALLVDAVTARQRAGLGGAVGLDALGGIASRPAANETAWVHRNAEWSAQYSVPLLPGQPPAAVAEDESWLGELYSSLRPYVSGEAYQNYIDPALADWAEAYYGSNLPALASVRRRWDPERVLDFPQAIPLAAT